MKVVTAEQMRELDRRAIEEFGIPGVVLMENAGRAVVEVMQREYGDLRGKHIAVFCGTGNNGGDGFVIARHLHLLGANVYFYLAGLPESLKGDARINYDVLRRLGQFIYDIKDYPHGMAIDICVDALLGTGLKDAPREPYIRAIQQINLHYVPVIIAVDIPSGVDSDTGATPEEAVRATHTVTFAYPKLGLFLPPGSDCVGKMHIARIGFDLPNSIETPCELYLGKEFELPVLCPGTLDAMVVAKVVPFFKRKGEANKGDFGHVAVIAGSRGMAGAPSLVAHAAQRSGAGLVTVLTAESAQPTVAAKLNEQMTLALPEEDGSLSEAAFDKIAKFAEKASVLCVGPGLTQNPQTVALVQRIITEIEKPLVLDADGLNALALNPDIISRRTEDPRFPLILTPHPGEAARLLGTTTDAVQSNRIASVQQLAARYRAVAVLKGRYTLTAEPSGKVYINTTGNPGMATGGSGDTLTGIVGGLLSQAVSVGRNAQDLNSYLEEVVNPHAVTALAVMLHGKAGDIAAEMHGEVGLIASDITDALPLAIRRLEENP